MIFKEGETYNLVLCNLPVICTWRYLGDKHHSPDFARLPGNRDKEHIIQANSDNERVECIKIDKAGLKPPIGVLSFGYYVKTITTEGIEQFYPHLKFENRFDIKPGQVLKKGQPIGIMGETGSATGVHIHPEQRINGKYINNQDNLNFKIDPIMQDKAKLQQLTKPVDTRISSEEQLMGQSKLFVKEYPNSSEAKDLKPLIEKVNVAQTPREERNAFRLLINEINSWMK